MDATSRRARRLSSPRPATSGSPRHRSNWSTTSTCAIANRSTMFDRRQAHFHVKEGAMRNMKPLWIVLVLGLVSALPALVSADTTLDRVKREKAAKIGFANEAPFSYTLADGTLVGSDYEIAKIVLGKLGVTNVEGVLVN